jgi:hypothetical protein
MEDGCGYPTIAGSLINDALQSTMENGFANEIAVTVASGSSLTLKKNVTTVPRTSAPSNKCSSHI